MLSHRMHVLAHVCFMHDRPPARHDICGACVHAALDDIATGVLNPVRDVDPCPRNACVTCNTTQCMYYCVSCITTTVRWTCGEIDETDSGRGWKSTSRRSRCARFDASECTVVSLWSLFSTVDHAPAFVVNMGLLLRKAPCRGHEFWAVHPR